MTPHTLRVWGVKKKKDKKEKKEGGGKGGREENREEKRKMKKEKKEVKTQTPPATVTPSPQVGTPHPMPHIKGGG